MARTRVLVADDNITFGAMLSRFVSSQPDMEVVGMAADGGEALQLAALFEPDVVLMDLCMPGLDGFAATRVLTQTHHAISVIALTAHRSDDSESRVREAGARAFLRKADVDSRLIDLIHGLTAGRSLGDDRHSARDLGPGPPCS